jgi:hypothetical protein
VRLLSRATNVCLVEVREELKGQELSFTAIAKIVGERWQVLPSEVRDVFEQQAQAAKEKYYAELSEYKKTSEYDQYQAYLAAFKAKHSSSRAGIKPTPFWSDDSHSRSLEGKRPKLEPQTGASTPSSTRENIEGQDAGSASTYNHLDGYSFRPGRAGSSPPAAGGYPGHDRPGYPATSASTSPSGYGSLQSPVVGPAYSPKSTSPSSMAGYPAFDLPHHAKSGTARELRLREPYHPATGSPGLPTGPSAPSFESKSAERSPMFATNQRRGITRPSMSLPELIHNDTTISDAGSLSSNGPYQGSLLPVLDAAKEDRRLPLPQPAPLMAFANPVLPPLDKHTAAGPPRERSHLDVLLRATEFARDAEQKEARELSR